MNTKNTTQFPQTVEIPQPLEVHPSVDPELARGLMAACEYIAANPDKFDMAEGHITYDGRGCVICHAARLSKWNRTAVEGSGIAADEQEVTSFPLGDWRRIYSPHGWNKENCGANNGYTQHEPRIARIEHFLRTGE